MMVPKHKRRAAKSRPGATDALTPRSEVGSTARYKTFAVEFKLDGATSDVEASNRRSLRPFDRGTYIASLTAETGRHADALKRFIECRGLGSQVVTIGAPTAFGIVAIRATDEAARAIEAMPNVVSVVKDAG